MDEREEMLLLIHENIEQHGQHLFRVYDDIELPFTYTIGNHERGLPELLLIGVSDKHDAIILNRLGHTMREVNRKAFRHGELVSVGGQFPVKIVDADGRAKTEFTIVAGGYYGTDDYRVQQVVCCDKNGRFPGDPECAEPCASQLILAAS